MGQTTSKIDEKEAVAGMGRLSIDKNAYVFVDNDTCTWLFVIYAHMFTDEMKRLLHTRRATGSAPSLWTKPDNGKRSFCLQPE